MLRYHHNISSGLFVYPFIKFFNTLADIMVVSSDQFELASPRCVAEDFGGEIVAINLDNGRYYSLRGFAFAVWHDLLAGHTPNTICELLAPIDDSIAGATAAFVTDLEHHGLIRRSAAATAPTQPIGCVAAAQNGLAPPAIEVFDDMADLITADPIHEVDNDAGWPVRAEPDS